MAVLLRVIDFIRMIEHKRYHAMAVKHDKQKSISTRDTTTPGYIWVSRTWNIWLIFTEVHPRYFRAETIVILLVCADTAINVSIASGRTLNRKTSCLPLTDRFPSGNLSKKKKWIKYFLKGAKRERFLELYASLFWSSWVKLGHCSGRAEKMAQDFSVRSVH